MCDMIRTPKLITQGVLERILPAMFTEEISEAPLTPALLLSRSLTYAICSGVKLERMLYSQVGFASICAALCENCFSFSFLFSSFVSSFLRLQIVDDLVAVLDRMPDLSTMSTLRRTLVVASIHIMMLLTPLALYLEGSAIKCWSPWSWDQSLLFIFCYQMICRSKARQRLHAQDLSFDSIECVIEAHEELIHLLLLHLLNNMLGYIARAFSTCSPWKLSGWVNIVPYPLQFGVVCM